jgi:hypothetical protein
MNEISRYQVNRVIVILIPKSPFLEWTYTVEPSLGLTLDELRAEQDALLLNISDIETLQCAKAWAYCNWKVLFDKALCDWYTDERYWPSARTLAMFEQWFDIEWHPLVWDLSSTQIEKIDWFRNVNPITNNRYP